MSMGESWRDALDGGGGGEGGGNKSFPFSIQKEK